MNAVEVSTVVYAPQEEIYAFLVDFTGYGQYSAYIEGIERSGEGGPGTEYDITVAWWKLEYTAHSEVTATTPPERIEWRLTGGLNAGGYWQVEPVESEAATAAESASQTDETIIEANRVDEGGPDAPAHRVVLRIEYEPDSVSSDSLSLPAFVPVDAVVDRVAPHVESEAESIVEDVVADLEGQRRDVELTVHEAPGRKQV